MWLQARDFSVNLVERLEQNSKNSSKPPSSDSPYEKATGKTSGYKDGMTTGTRQMMKSSQL